MRSGPSPGYLPAEQLLTTATRGRQGCGFDTMGTGMGYNAAAYYKSYFTQDFGCSRDDFNCQCPQIIDPATSAAPVPVPAPVCVNGMEVPATALAAAPVQTPVRPKRVIVCGGLLGLCLVCCKHTQAHRRRRKANAAACWLCVGDLCRPCGWSVQPSAALSNNPSMPSVARPSGKASPLR